MSKEKKRFIKWIVYWLLVLGFYITISLVFGNFIMYTPVLAFAMANFVIRLVADLSFGKIRHKVLSKVLRHGVNVLSLVILVSVSTSIIQNGSNYNIAYIESLDYSPFLAFPPHSSVTYNSENGVYTVRMENEELKILQLTDIHLCGSITTIGTDRKAIDACCTLIKEVHPDLIILTGDVVFPIPYQTFSKNNLRPIVQLCIFMNRVGIPWVLVYGNHDTEVVATYDVRSFEGMYRFFLQEEESPMLYAEKQPEVYGRYNQYLRIENSDGSLNRLIFLVDSNDYVKDSTEVNEYDSVHEDQLEWYAETIDEVSAEEGETVKSFVFMHIPFQEFADAKVALDAGDEDAVYLFGENGEAVSHPNHNSGFFDVILEKGSTEAVFVGHDHINNMGIKYKGVDLVYSKSIDYIAYPGIAHRTEQRGGTLITLSKDGSYQIEQIDYAQ